MCCSPWGHKESDTTERLNKQPLSSCESWEIIHLEGLDSPSVRWEEVLGLRPIGGRCHLHRQESALYLIKVSLQCLFFSPPILGSSSFIITGFSSCLTPFVGNSVLLIHVSPLL